MSGTHFARVNSTTGEENFTEPHDGRSAALAHIASFAVRSVVGGRKQQEDFCSVAPMRLNHKVRDASASGSQLQHDDALFAGVFDGHGGNAVSKLCAANFSRVVEANLSKCGDETVTALREAFKDVDQLIQQQQQQADGSPSCTAPEPLTAGSTALIALVDGISIFTAHCGDSRAVLSRGGSAVELTRDHKPTDAAEKDRIELAGGRVFWNGGYRVMGVLAMSRALGDLHLQPYGVSPEPEVSHFPRTIADEFLILASDGLWDTLTNQDAVDLALMSLSYARSKGASAASAGRLVTKALVHAAQQRGSRDNITVVFVDLQRQQPEAHTTSCTTGYPAAAAAATTASRCAALAKAGSVPQQCRVNAAACAPTFSEPRSVCTWASCSTPAGVSLEESPSALRSLNNPSVSRPVAVAGLHRGSPSKRRCSTTPADHAPLASASVAAGGSTAPCDESTEAEQPGGAAKRPRVSPPELCDVWTSCSPADPRSSPPVCAVPSTPTSPFVNHPCIQSSSSSSSATTTALTPLLPAPVAGGAPFAPSGKSWTPFLVDAMACGLLCTVPLSGYQPAVETTTQRRGGDMESSVAAVWASGAGTPSVSGVATPPATAATAAAAATSRDALTSSALATSLAVSLSGVAGAPPARLHPLMMSGVDAFKSLLVAV